MQAVQKDGTQAESKYTKVHQNRGIGMEKVKWSNRAHKKWWNQYSEACKQSVVRSTYMARGKLN